MIFDLVKDFADVLNAMPEGHSRRRILKLLDEAIRRDVHFIDRHPTTFFQCMWNTCWWYDCEEAAEHYEEPDCGWKDPPPWENKSVRLSKILESWRDDHAIRAVTWIRSLRPPLLHLGTFRQIVVRGGDNQEGLKSIAKCFAVSVDRRWVVAPGIGLVDLSNGTVTLEGLFRDGHRNSCDSLAISPDGRWIVASEYGSLELYNALTGKLQKRFRGHQFGNPAFQHEPFVGDVAFDPAGRRVVSGGRDGTVRVWNVDIAQEIQCLKGHEDPVQCVAWSTDGRLIASGSGSIIGHARTVRIWDGDSGKELQRLNARDPVKCVEFSPDQSLLVSAFHFRGTLNIWDVATGELVRQIGRDDLNRVDCVALSLDGKQVAAGLSDGTLCIWSITTGEEIFREMLSTGVSIIGLGSLPGGRIVCLTRDRNLWLCDAEGAEETRQLRGSRNTSTILSDAATPLAVSADGRRIITATHGRRIQVWDTRSATEIRCLEAAHDQVCGIAASADGRRIVAECRCIASSSIPGAVQVWNTHSGHLVRQLHDASTTHRPAAGISPDGNLIVTTASGLKVWSVETGDELWPTPRMHVPSVARFRFSPDGRWLALMGADEIQVRDAETGRSVRKLRVRGQTGSVFTGLSFSPDGLRLAGTTKDGIIHLWRIETGEELQRVDVEKHAFDETRAAFSTDGQRIISVSQDVSAEMRCWDLETGKCRKIVKWERGFKGLSLRQVILPVRALARGSEVVFEDSTSDRVIGWWSTTVDAISPCFESRVWCGLTDKEFWLVQVESTEVTF